MIPNGYILAKSSKKYPILEGGGGGEGNNKTTKTNKQKKQSAFTLTRTSCAFGGATSISSTESDLPAAQATAALHRITWKNGSGEAV